MRHNNNNWRHIFNLILNKKSLFVLMTIAPSNCFQNIMSSKYLVEIEFIFTISILNCNNQTINLSLDRENFIARSNMLCLESFHSVKRKNNVIDDKNCLPFIYRCAFAILAWVWLSLVSFQRKLFLQFMVWITSSCMFFRRSSLEYIRFGGFSPGFTRYLVFLASLCFLAVAL